VVDRNGWRFPRQVFSFELVGTALLVWGGLSVVLRMFGAGSPMARVVPGEGYAIWTVVMGEAVTTFRKT
jgi:hypothetical protein